MFGPFDLDNAHGRTVIVRLLASSADGQEFDQVAVGVIEIDGGRLRPIRRNAERRTLDDTDVMAIEEFYCLFNRAFPPETEIFGSGHRRAGQQQGRDFLVTNRVMHIDAVGADAHAAGSARSAASERANDS